MKTTTGLNWRKSSYSSANGGNCIEAGQAPSAVLIRDTKDNGTGPVLRVAPDDWRRFTRAVCLPHPRGR